MYKHALEDIRVTLIMITKNRTKSKIRKNEETYSKNEI